MRNLITALLILLFFRSYSQNDKSLQPSISNENNQVIEHSFYMLEYSEQHEQALWVYYVLTPEYIKGAAERKNNFKADNIVSSSSASLSDYKSSGYDRGHLCPAGSMKISQKAMDESFYMSNMSPQLAGFNRGKWKQLESMVRNWVLQEGELYVVTGSILSPNMGSIGTNNVTIPSSYYKVIYDPTNEKKMIGFIMPHAKLENPISTYAVSVDDVERATGIDFFPSLPDSLENHLESNIFNWSFTTTKTTEKPKEESRSKAIQCLGNAKSTGNRCRNKTKNMNGYCHHHQDQEIKINTKYIPILITPPSSGKCTATTKAGIRCKRSASSGSSKCWQH